MPAGGPESTPASFCTARPLACALHSVRKDGVVVKWLRHAERLAADAEGDHADLVGYRIKMEAWIVPSVDGARDT